MLDHATEAYRSASAWQNDWHATMRDLLAYKAVISTSGNTFKSTYTRHWGGIGPNSCSASCTLASSCKARVANAGLGTGRDAGCTAACCSMMEYMGMRGDCPARGGCGWTAREGVSGSKLASAAAPAVASRPAPSPADGSAAYCTLGSWGGGVAVGRPSGRGPLPLLGSPMLPTIQGEC